MSSKNCPETPRQRMIGMMYLFLTAMLAINVSPEILNSFILVDNSLKKSVENVSLQNEDRYKDFKAQLDSNYQKVEKWYKIAEEVRTKSDNLVNYIDELKETMAKDADGADYVEGHLKKIDNTDVANRILLLGNNSKGKELREFIGTYKEYLAGVLDAKPSLKNFVMEALDTPKPAEGDEAHGGHKSNDPGFKTWEYEMFGEKPLISTMALLTKIENDIRNTESITVNYLFGQINAADIKVNDISAFAIPKTNYILKGGKFSATIGIAAIDTTAKPEIQIVGGPTLKRGTNKYERVCNSVGTFRFKAIVRMKDGSGVMKDLYTEEIEYEVAEPNVNVAATKMNVFYSGVDNPVRVSLPGVSSNDIEPTINNGEMLKQPDGTYIVRPEKIGQAIVSVKAKIDGKWQVVGSGAKFRVKQLPSPTIYLGRTDKPGEELNPQKLSRIAANDKRLVLGAWLKDNDFEASYEVVGYTIQSYDGYFDENVNDKTFTASVRNKLKSKAGAKYSIFNVKVKFPDGSTRVIYKDSSFNLYIR